MTRIDTYTLTVQYEDNNKKYTETTVVILEKEDRLEEVRNSIKKSFAEYIDVNSSINHPP